MCNCFYIRIVPGFSWWRERIQSLQGMGVTTHPHPINSAVRNLYGKSGQPPPRFLRKARAPLVGFRGNMAEPINARHFGEIWRNESPKDTEVAADERRTSLFIFGRKMADNDNAVVVYQAHQPVKQPTSEVLVDALPYIDQGYDDSGVREAASSMVEEETRRYRPTKNYLDHLATANFSQFETEIMKSEFERLQARLPMDMLSMKRYELPQPPAGKMTDIAAWSECVDNSMAQLEHQATRIANLELMADYGCEAWKSYLSLLLSLANRAQKQLLELKKQIQEVNWHRKNDQTAAGDKLGSLETNWVALVSKNYELEIACAELEKKIQMLHHHQAEMRVQAAPAPSTA